MLMLSHAVSKMHRQYYFDTYFIKLLVIYYFIMIVSVPDFMTGYNIVDYICTSLGYYCSGSN